MESTDRDGSVPGRRASLKARAEGAPKLHMWTRDEIVATWRRVLVVVYRHETTLDGLEVVQTQFDELAGRHAGGAFSLVVVEQNAPYPSPQARAMLARFLLTRAPQLLLSAVVYEGTGFRATAVRSIVSGLALVARLPYRHRIFATVDDAARWICENSPVKLEWTQADLLGAVGEIRTPGSGQFLARG